VAPKFSRVGPNLIQSDAGFSVEVLGRTGLRYSEGDKTLFIDSEMLASKGFAIYRDPIKNWDPPHQAVRISPHEKNTIIKNVQLAFESQGEPTHLYDGRPIYDDRIGAGD
jgi:hypothetical protein